MDYDSLHFSSHQTWPTPQGKVVFLDRDGTITFENPIEKADGDLKIIPGAKEALKELKDKGFYLVLVSNQPRVGRGFLTEDRLREINEKLQEDLEIKFDCILYCPHATDAQGVYKLDCNWKKPKPGMLLYFLKKFNLDSKDYFLIGDSYKDIEAGKEAGVKTILVGEDTEDLKADFHASNLKTAVNLVLNN